VTTEDETTAAYADLRARRDALLEFITKLPDSAPELPAAWGPVGSLSYQMFLIEGDERDLRRAEQALPKALAAAPEDDDYWNAQRIVHANVRAWRYDLDVQAGQADPASLDAIVEEASAGVRALEGISEYAEVAAMGRFVLALVAKARCDENPHPDAVTAALATHEEALACLPRGSVEWVKLHRARAELLWARARVGGGRPDYAAAADHYRAALTATPEGPERVKLRHDLALTLLNAGRLDSDPDTLRQGLAELDGALGAVASVAGPPPGWEWDARVFDIYFRVVLWSEWGDQAEAAAAASRLAALLAEPGTEDRIEAPFLADFALLRYDGAARADDDAGRDEALAMLRRAVARWRPEYGSVGRNAILLGYLQLGRYHDTGDPDRLAAVAEAARRVLDADPEAETPVARGVAQSLLLATGSRDVTVERETVMALIRFVSECLAEGETNLSDEEFTALERDVRGAGRRTRPIEEAYERWRRTEPGSAEHGELAKALLAVLPMAQWSDTRFTREQCDALIEATVAAAQDGAAAHTAHVVAAQALSRYALDGDDEAWDEVLAHLDAAGATTPGDAFLGRAAEALRSFALYYRGQHRGGLDDVDVGLAGAPGLLELFDEGEVPSAVSRGSRVELATVQGLRAAARGDLAAADRHLATLAEDLSARGFEDTTRIMRYTAHEELRLARDTLAWNLGVPLAPPPPGGELPLAEVRRQAARLSGGPRAWVLGDGGMARSGRATMTDEPRALEDGLKLLRDALGLTEEGSQSWTRYALALGNGSVALSICERSPFRRRALLDEGITRLEQLRDRIEATNRLWFNIGQILGPAYRMRAEGAGRARRDDRANARGAILSALRGFAWSVLLQSGTEHATEAVGRASEVALQAAAWCLTDNEPAEAVTALDSCRGLMLHAATTSRSVAERLAAVGEEELAAEWRAATGAREGDAEVPSELRHRVLAQLTGPASRERQPQGRLLDPPSLAEIGSALRALGRDALVYLVPALRPLPPPPGMMPGRWSNASPLPWGAAVVVTADGEARRVVLPRLAEDAEPLRAYAPTAGPNRDLGPVTGVGATPEGVPFRERLDRLCRWAWDAAMRDLLAEFAPLRRARRRQPRLAVVPMGVLAAVPWHAAWRPGGEGGRRYAFAEAEVSYAASARLLCEVAARPAALHGGAALVVGDPMGDLRYAGVEAEAVHRAFYPGGTFLGGGAATPGRVGEWLGSPGGPGGVLHLACHATVAAPLAAVGGRRRSAYLSLHGGEMSAEEVVESAAPELEVVVLAACRSQVSGRGHDEAFSLSTAFLVAGAGSVIGSLWPVPDDATSVLMFLTHHYLRSRRLPPGQALRRAQLWMLDPQRRLPPDMPPELIARAARIDPDDLTAWAGFTHLGR
jgi:tetratricopeptide (TPR) repeat protein